MKKLILLIAFLSLTALSFADKKGGEPRFIITDCGTIYQIPDDLSDEEAANLIDLLSEVDCYS